MELLVKVVLFLVELFLIAGLIYVIITNNKLQKQVDGMDLKKELTGVESTVQSLAKDLDAKFGYYAHDPYSVIATDASTDQTTKSVTVNGSVTSSLNLGKAQVRFDDNAQALTLSNGYGSSRLALFPDAVDISAPRINIGDYNLRATKDGLQVCKLGKDCKMLWKAAA